MDIPMKNFCRACLIEDEISPLHPIVDKVLHNLFVGSSFIELRHVDQSEGELCTNCVLQCLRWKLLERQAIECNTISRNSSFIENYSNICGVCLEDVLLSQSESEIYQETRQKLMDSSSTVAWPGDISRKQLCASCLNKCVRWNSFRCQAIESDQKLKNLLPGELSRGIGNVPLDIEEIKVERIDEEDAPFEFVDVSCQEASAAIVKSEDPVEPTVFETKNDPDEGESSNAEDEDESDESYKETTSSNESCSGDERTKNSTETSPANNKKHRKKRQGKERQFHCTHCDKVFRYRGNLIKHQEIHTTEIPFQCEECLQSFHDGFSLKRHRRIHTGERPFQCKLCPKSFSDSSNLASHQRVHMEVVAGVKLKPFACQECGKAFTNTSELKRHNRTHTGEKPFKCEFCQRSFSQSAHLISHRRIHTGERPYQCPDCSKTFADRSSWAAHKRIHTGEKPFQCPICLRSFTKHSQLKTHKRIHNRE